jgi:hypothetical protein
MYTYVPMSLKNIKNEVQKETPKAFAFGDFLCFDL